MWQARRGISNPSSSSEQYARARKSNTAESLYSAALLIVFWTLNDDLKLKVVAGHEIIHLVCSSQQCGASYCAPLFREQSRLTELVNKKNLFRTLTRSFNRHQRCPRESWLTGLNSPSLATLRVGFGLWFSSKLDQHSTRLTSGQATVNATTIVAEQVFTKIDQHSTRLTSGQRGVDARPFDDYHEF